MISRKLGEKDFPAEKNLGVKDFRAGKISWRKVLPVEQWEAFSRWEGGEKFGPLRLSPFTFSCLQSLKFIGS